MKLKYFIVLSTLTCLLLAGCNQTGEELPSSSEVSQPSIQESTGETPKDTSGVCEEAFPATKEIALTESAELLTMAITQSTMGFSTSSDPESNHLVYPSAQDPNSVNQFLYLLAAYQSVGYEYSLYANDIYQDQDGIIHLSAEEISTILQDVLGISTWDPSTSHFEYDAATQEYYSGLEFGIGCGGWKCGEIIHSEIDLSSKEITVEFKAEYLFPGASGNDNETTSWMCKNIFSINEREDGQIFLSFKKSVIL